ncbi:hypothetical protein THIOSC15_590003 [uncultured Thiomicrorhabdus sp.]
MQNAASYLANLSATAQRKEQERGIKPANEFVQAVGHAGDKVKEKPLNTFVESRKQLFTPEIKQVLDYVFETLWGANPAWRAGFKNRNEMVNYKIQLGRAMESAGINTVEKVEDGLDYAIKQPGAFMPSTGDFVTWCKDIAEIKRQKRKTEERSKRILDEKRQLAGDTWEERQAAAKAGIAELRKQLGG